MSVRIKSSLAVAVSLQVPSSVSHADFWQRYFYKLWQLEQDEARRAALKKRAEDSSATSTHQEDQLDDSEGTFRRHVNSAAAFKSAFWFLPASSRLCIIAFEVCDVCLLAS